MLNSIRREIIPAYTGSAAHPDFVAVLKRYGVYPIIGIVCPLFRLAIQHIQSVPCRSPYTLTIQSQSGDNIVAETIGSSEACPFVSSFVVSVQPGPGSHPYEFGVSRQRGDAVIQQSEAGGIGGPLAGGIVVSVQALFRSHPYILAIHHRCRYTIGYQSTSAGVEIVPFLR